MSVGIALYNTDGLTALNAYEIGEFIFDRLHINITTASYYKPLPNGDHTSQGITAKGLLKKLEQNNELQFGLYCIENNETIATFYHITKEFGSFYNLNMQYAHKIENQKQFMVELAKKVTEFIDFPYGISFELNDMFETYFYTEGEIFYSVYKYESPNTWNRETPGRFKGSARYKESMLRMIYKFNIINDRHLEIKLNNAISLRDWILSDTKHGELTKINNKLWLWSVDNNQLDHINKVCGEAGILISWREA
ncbi:hypothetical protein [Xylocopilactobacillus apicola]|uniref:Uncharacterized protein n=1 Tax=Xylocopilactobacillus apicola TaxID=2932184 RepID=A0AAU9DUV1_9LACO|nr:hypothetical protein [Xylocopilactobacillus apicola]BDR57648.1 hypothetical protein XA3_00890 [Xylocopilactobacillus apicola]